MTLAESLPPLLRRLDARADGLEAKSRRLSHVRLATVGAGVAAALVLGNTVGPWSGWAAIVAMLAVFAVLAKVHDRVEAALARVRLWRTLRARDLARIERDWSALGPAPAPPPPGHAYASDLDVVGPRSLLHLLDTTGTEAGHDRLRSWLLGDEPDDATTRQAQVRALVPRRRFRQRLALLGHEAGGGADARWDDGPVHAWLAERPDPSLYRWAAVLGLLALTTVVLIGVDVAGGPRWWGASFGLYVVLTLWKYAAVATVFDRAYDLQRALRQGAGVLRFVEADPAGRDPALAPLWAAFRGERAPSRRLDRLQRIVGAAAVTRNEVGRVVVNAILPYDFLLSIALDRLRSDLADLFEPWLDALADVEALAALAAFADRQPDTVFPDLAADGPLFDARDLRHPLLPGPVGNDVALAPGGVVIVTGSNMSGKSTFMRAVGLASVLATAGGPVPAAALALRPLRPVTSMRIGDAVQEGLSTFYAEVRRLRALLDTVEAAGPPALVLIDEMLRGTNNRERLAGAQGVVRALAGARATSLVATHDLLLADLADEDDRIRNAHFRETAEGDRLAFDYRLREGPCPTTNALVIMRRAGLPVGEPAPVETEATERASSR